MIHGPKYDLIISQVTSANRPGAGKRWTHKNISLALSLYHSYRRLRNILDLSSTMSLKIMMCNIAVYPSFNEKILKKLENFPPNSRLVSLVFDEMSVKEGVSYDSGRDLLEGLDEGLERGKVQANHAIGFMVRGLTEKWKQPIGYFLSSGTMSGKEMKSLLLDCIAKLKKIGLTVLVIGDQGSNNRNLFEKHLGVNSDQPFFITDDQKVFAMYDPPHLIKNERNNFKKQFFVIDGHNILWDHVKIFFDQDSPMPIRLAPKLKKKHIDLPPFSPLRVRLAFLRRRTYS